MVASELDEKLLIETAQRDPRHFAELYRIHFDRVYAYVSRRVATRSDAQDLTAEVFQQALANLGRFEWRGVPFAAWLYRIAANAVTDHHHRTVRDQNVPPHPEPGRKSSRAPSGARRSIARSATCLRTSGASSRCGSPRVGPSPRSPECSGEAREP
jgi:DNA-directed RNA polymerase specialized sigma24 family protein